MSPAASDAVGLIFEAVAIGYSAGLAFGLFVLLVRVRG